MTSYKPRVLAIMTTFACLCVRACVRTHKTSNPRTAFHGGAPKCSGRTKPFDYFVFQIIMSRVIHSSYYLLLPVFNEKRGTPFSGKSRNRLEAAKRGSCPSVGRSLQIETKRCSSPVHTGASTTSIDADR